MPTITKAPKIPKINKIPKITPEPINYSTNNMKINTPQGSCSNGCMPDKKMVVIAFLVTLGTVVCLGLLALMFLVQYRTQHDMVERLSWRDVSNQLELQRQQLQEEKRNSATINVVTPTVQTKSFVSYASERGTTPIAESAIPANFEKIAEVVIDNCTDDSDGPCGGQLGIYTERGWETKTGNQTFYLVQPGGAGNDWYGPYSDDLKRIVTEAKFVKSIAR